MKKVLSVVLCICMLITGVPLVSLAADDPVKIVSVTANDNQVFDSDQIKVEFTGPTDAETVNYFTVELCYTYETNGHPYKVRRRSGTVRPNDDGVYTITMTVPYNLLDDDFLKPTLTVVTVYKDETETAGEPVPLTDSAEKRIYCSPLKVTVGDTVYTYGPGLDEAGEVKTTFPEHEENGVFFDPDTRTLTLSGASGAAVEAASLAAGKDLNKIVLNGAVFDSIRLYEHKPVEIELIGANAGNLIADDNSDIFIKGVDGASLTGFIDANSAACILSNVAWSENATGQQRYYSDLRALNASVVAFDNCAVNISSESAKEPVAYVGVNNSFATVDINGYGMVVRDCADFRVTHALRGIYCDTNDLLIDNSEMTVVGVHDGATQWDKPDFVGIDEKGISVDIALQNRAKLNLDMTENGSSNSVNALRCENLTVDESSEINVKVLASEESEGGVSGMFPQHLHLYGKAQVDVTNLNGRGVTGLSMGYSEIRGGRLTINVDGKATVYGFSSAGLDMTDKSSLTVNAVGRIESGDDERVSLFDPGIDQTIIDSTVDLSFMSKGSGKYSFFTCMHYFGTTEIRGSTLRVGIHNAGSKLNATRFNLISDYSEVTDSSVPKIIARVPADYLSLAQQQVDSFVRTGFDSSVDLAECICSGDRIDENCMKSTVSEPVRVLSVSVPKAIADRAAKLGKSRLVITKDGEQKTVWEGRSVAEGVKAYAFSDETYSDAKLQSLLSGEYRTVAYYEGEFSNSGEIALKTDFDNDFFYVEGIGITDADGNPVPGDAYRATVTDSEGKAWAVPGFLTAGSYTVTLEGRSYSKLYDYETFNKSKKNSFTAAEGVVSFGGLRLIVPSVTVSGTVRDANGKALPGICVRADQTLKNGYGYSVNTQSDTAGRYRLTLYGASAVNGNNSFSAQYTSYLLVDADGKIIKNNRFETKPQKDGATVDLTLKKMPSSIVSLSYSVDKDAAADEATQKYLKYLSKNFTLSGEIDGKQLKNNFNGNADLSSGQYSLWNNADAACLIDGGKTLTLSVLSGCYSIADTEKTIKLDADNCAAAALSLIPRAGIVAAIRAQKRQGIGSYGAAWYDAQGNFVGESKDRKMIGGETQTVSFDSPVNESGSYTVVFSPFSAPEKLADVDASLTRINVGLVKDRGV
ncbi:MAG: carboxypeptidase regulatory-like domain-containing protein, partial [Clostridia bacterium]|nr:carboxypeptidase regulatory-like domain-containing protein [Clostridia bacterium]